MTARDPPRTSAKKGTVAKKPANTTSVDQLQVYHKPEYKNFTEALNPRSAQTIRPKRMNLLQTLRMIEEIYSFRFGVKRESTTLH